MCLMILSPLQTSLFLISRLLYTAEEYTAEEYTLFTNLMDSSNWYVSGGMVYVSIVGKVQNFNLQTICMYPGDGASDLPELTQMEEMLISPVHALVQLWKI